MSYLRHAFRTLAFRIRWAIEWNRQLDKFRSIFGDRFTVDESTRRRYSHGDDPQ